MHLHTIKRIYATIYNTWVFSSKLLLIRYLLFLFDVDPFVIVIFFILY